MEESKEKLVSDVKGLAKYFELDFSIKLFGKLLWSWHWPPQN